MTSWPGAAANEVWPLGMAFQVSTVPRIVIVSPSAGKPMTVTVSEACAVLPRLEVSVGWVAIPMMVPLWIGAAPEIVTESVTIFIVPATS
jgi:hypothetical protein